jgi:hypothetical protein
VIRSKPSAKEKSLRENTVSSRGKINKWGASGIGLLVFAFVIPFRYPFCVLIPLSFLSALACGITAAVRGSKVWLIPSAFAAALAVQTTIAVLVDC